MIKIKKISNISGYKRLKKPMLNKGDVLTQDYGYTIETKRRVGSGTDTLWRGLPTNYKLKGKIISKDANSQYQGQPANKLVIERISESPKSGRLRKKYLVWQLKNGILIK